MKRLPIISVVVINYNNQEYLAGAIQSIIKQSFTNWECIIVDDGSTDNSRDIIREQTAGDKRFNLIFQDNQGGSAARNTGLRAVRGQWIMFLDSDDCYTPIAMELLLSLAKEFQADLVGGNALIAHDGFKPDIKHQKFDAIMSQSRPFFVSENPRACIDYFEMQKAGLPETFKFLWVWRQLFYKDLLKDIFFPEDLFPGEDILFMLEVMNRAKKIVMTNVFVTYHRLSKTSSVNNGLTKNNTTYFIETIKRARPILEKYPPALGEHLTRELTRTLFADMIMKTMKFKEFRDVVAQEIRKTYGTPDLPIHYLKRWQRIMIYLFLKSFPESKKEKA